MIHRKSADEVARMRVSGEMAGTVLDRVIGRLSPGVATSELDEYAAELIAAYGAKSCFHGYRGFPGILCISVNDQVVHGIAGTRRIEMGDIVSLDCGVIYDGYIGDTARTAMVGVQDPEVIRLVKVTEEALMAGISKAVAGGRLSDISHEVEMVATDAGFSVVRDFVGHGVGSELHEDPQIPNFGPAGKGPRLKAGMTLAIEPMVNMGGPDIEVMDDGWTVLTRDRKPSAHFEHTVLVGEDSAEILTWPKEKK